MGSKRRKAYFLIPALRQLWSFWSDGELTILHFGTLFLSITLTMLEKLIPYDLVEEEEREMLDGNLYIILDNYACL